MKFSLVQILGTVAIIQMKNLRIEVEKGFRWTMFGPELVDPNVEINFDNELNGYRRDFLEISIFSWVFIGLFSEPWTTFSDFTRKGK